MKINCASCSRQICTGAKSSDRYVAPSFGARRGIANEWFCGDCAKDMDTNGLFPEEQATAYREPTNA